MSRYLVDRIAAHAEHRSPDRDRRSPRSKAQDGILASDPLPLARARARRCKRAIRHLFLFIGAEPNTDWLAGSGVTLDDKGFVRTGGERPRSRSKPACPAFSPSAMCAPARSSASPRRWAKARKWWRRCTPFWRAAERQGRASPARIGETVMADECAHADAIRDVTPSALGCEECLKIGSRLGASAPLPHLRPCRLLRRFAEPPRHQTFPSQRAIRSSKAMIRRKAGAGAMSTR